MLKIGMAGFLGGCVLLYQVTAFSTIVSLEKSKEDCVTAFIDAAHKDVFAHQLGTQKAFNEAKEDMAQAELKCKAMENKAKTIAKVMQLPQ
ncbi:hypothetical protein UNDKW_2904 [Undibacterium sp. KW1]|uniref:hypothetical protein n=1 Tax=Undibacterium sp. KW1 TaxID=2058624 RepID=UPI001331EC79|nr:hypothetical protein [Undibacterium sp. KW1]BBB61177.1 hypothetical protein UNDKW_2904 [Undibacterium sp. KW1]